MKNQRLSLIGPAVFFRLTAGWVHDRRVPKGGRELEKIRRAMRRVDAQSKYTAAGHLLG